MPSSSDKTISAAALRVRLARLFAAGGLSPHAAARMAEALVEADLEGVSSHGTLQAPVYLRRLRGGSISPAEAAECVLDRSATAVLDAHHMFGHLAADQAIALAVEKARALGAGVVAVRNGFHFGVAGRYARAAAEAGCIGMAMCNVRPLIAAPGGAERLVGNNPLAIALPTAQAPIVLDMAMSEAAFAKIRVAHAAGKPIPSGWAVSASGQPTTDAAEALVGMLLPAGGAKGFGLAFVIDLMCGLLADGAWGEAVRGVYDEPPTALNVAYLFIAIDTGHFGSPDRFRQGASAAAERVRGSKRAPGSERIRVPGDAKREHREASGGMVTLPAAVLESLAVLDAEFGLRA